MQPLEFAKVMVRYEELYRELKALEEQINNHVLETKETQKIGNVTAKYSNGRTSYAYHLITSYLPMETLRPYIDKHSTMVEKIDWRAICKELDYPPPIEKEPIPYVKVEVKE